MGYLKSKKRKVLSALPWKHDSGRENMILNRENTILVALGSSLSFSGNAPPDIITMARRALGKFVEIRASSRLYLSPAWPDPSDPPFTNAVVRAMTCLGPEPLLAALHAVEAGFGRARGRPNRPRTLDLDLIDYGGLVLATGTLSLPHPRLRTRDFVLLPLAEVAPNWRHPGTGESVQVLISALPAVSAVPAP